MCIKVLHGVHHPKSPLLTCVAVQSAALVGTAARYMADVVVECSYTVLLYCPPYLQALSAAGQRLQQLQ
jgi:hypothetical protein